MYVYCTYTHLLQKIQNCLGGKILIIFNRVPKVLVQKRHQPKPK